MTTEIKPRAVYVLKRTDKPDDGKDIYVGSTSLSLKKRLSQHRGAAKVQNAKLYKRMSEVGTYSWQILPLVVCVCDKKEIREFEMQWVELLKPDLNTFLPIDSKATDAKKESDKKQYLESLEAKRYYCEVCDMAFGHKCNQKKHFNSNKHKNKSFEQLIEDVHEMIKNDTFSQALENSKETIF